MSTQPAQSQLASLAPVIAASIAAGASLLVVYINIRYNRWRDAQESRKREQASEDQHDLDRIGLLHKAGEEIRAELRTELDRLRLEILTLKKELREQEEECEKHVVALRRLQVDYDDLSRRYQQVLYDKEIADREKQELSSRLEQINRELKEARALINNSGTKV